MRENGCCNKKRAAICFSMSQKDKLGWFSSVDHQKEKVFGAIAG